MSNQNGIEPLVFIERASDDLYKHNRAVILPGGAVQGLGMGMPYIDPIRKDAMLKIDTSFIASVTAVGLQAIETEEADQSTSLDFVVPLGVVGAGLATLALSRRMEMSYQKKFTEHLVPTGERMKDLALSVVVTDTDLRRSAFAKNNHEPGNDDILEIVPPFIPSHPQEEVEVPLYLNEGNVLHIDDFGGARQVGAISFDPRLHSSTLPAGEQFRRSDWIVKSMPFSGYLLQVLTGSTVTEIDIEQSLPDNVRHLREAYGS